MAKLHRARRQGEAEDKTATSPFAAQVARRRRPAGCSSTKPLLAARLTRHLTDLGVHRTAKTARKANVEPWASSPKSVVYNTAAFAPTAWKALREKAGEPDWTPPPRPAPGWAELPAE